MERAQKKSRSDAELKQVFLPFFDNLSNEVLYRILLESGLSVRDVHRACQITNVLQELCNDEFWDELYVNRFLGRNRKDPRFLEWQEERKVGMTDNYAHLIFRELVEVDDETGERTAFLMNDLKHTMKIEYIPTGDFAGVELDYTLGTDELALDITGYIKRLLGSDYVQLDNVAQARRNKERYVLHYAVLFDRSSFTDIVYNAIIDGWTQSPGVRDIVLNNSPIAAATACAICDKDATIKGGVCGGCESITYCGDTCAEFDWSHGGHHAICSKWIQKAHLHKGALTRKARARGETTTQYEHDVESGRIHASTKTKRQVALAETFKKMHRK
jgi:hypothetical protein